MNKKKEDVKEVKKVDAEARKKEKAAAKINHREEFRKLFAKLSIKMKLDASMEGVIWLHLKASNFAEKDKFEEGLKHFGYKL